LIREQLANLASSTAPGTAFADFLENALHIPVQRINERPLPLPDLLKEHHRNEFGSWIQKAWFAGLIHDNVFEESEGDDPDPEDPGYQGLALFAVDWTPALPPTRTQLTGVIRAFNRSFHRHPVILLIRHGEEITLATCERSAYRQEWREGEKAGRVTLLRGIQPAAPHAGHLRILNDLRLPRKGAKAVTDFAGLYAHWRKIFDTDILSQSFYRELSDWFFWACREVTFPGAPAETDFDSETEFAQALRAHNATSIIRLITRLLFTWFLKEKGLVPETLFERAGVERLLKKVNDPSAYYKAVLQNLFFATFNKEMGDREFRKAGSNYNVTTLYRYEDFFVQPQTFLDLQQGIPFLNCALFECQDKEHPTKTNANGNPLVQRLDGFSDRKDNPLHVPDDLFWGEDRPVDLSVEYEDAKPKNRTVRGLIHILNSYKFTITENTPLEQDIALDPELLGKVFENLLAAYNPETQTTARKQTGSFYTPREIVEFMVDQAVKAYLGDLPPAEMTVPRQIEAIQSCRILDPACGSGAFPMGALQYLVDTLKRLDPDNAHWKRAQLEVIERIPDPEQRENAIERFEEAFAATSSHDYGRKLYLIENCIFGVDIQPIAVQISQLRFFISLMVEQTPDPAKPNLGIKPLPSLETKFVAANTLLGVDTRLRQGNLFDDNRATLQRVAELRARLAEIRHRHFSARTPATKRKYREQDKAVRDELAETLHRGGLDGGISHQLAAWDPYDQNASASFFDPEWMFNTPGGFDIVIGNPPYVRQEKIKDLKPALKVQYPRFTSTADLYVYFYDRGFQLLKPDTGVLCYITSNKYFRSSYGAKLRDFLRTKTTLLHLTDFGDAPVFTAIAYPSILVARNRQPESENEIPALSWNPEADVLHFPEIFSREHFTIHQKQLDPRAWRIENQDVLRLLEKLKNSGTPLGKYVNGRFYYGIKTGFNQAFVINGETRDRLIREDPNCEEITKPFLRGRDVKKWHVIDPGLWLIFTRRGIDIDQYPSIKKHLSQYREQLEPKPNDWPKNKPWTGRKAGPYQWYEIQDNIAYWEEFACKKICYQEIATYQAFAMVDEGWHINNKLFMLPGLSYADLAILNSKVTWWFLSHICGKMVGGAYAMQWPAVSQIPIPILEEKQKTKLEYLGKTASECPEKIKHLENYIDEALHEIYRLNHRDIKIIADLKHES
jgi:adenine-specific DNA-methyltransferase